MADLKIILGILLAGFAAGFETGWLYFFHTTLKGNGLKEATLYLKKGG